jgi:hypothetical protein
MGSPGLVAESRFKIASDFYLHSPFRDRRFLSALVNLVGLLAFSVLIVIKAWSHISIYSIAWITFSMFWAVRLFRLVLHSHGSLRMLLAHAQVDATGNESRLGNALTVIAEVSSGALFFSFFAIFCLLMAMVLILSGR